jgi:ribulose-5-phosphate 4-epimerase/fuculose-1-phosphate aldolase
MKELLLLSHELSKFVVGVEGNVSGKVSNDSFLVKSSGTKMHCLTEDDLTLCDLSGNQLDLRHKKPSMESKFHAWFQQQPDVNFVGHVHPTSLLKILCMSDKIIESYAYNRLFPDQVIFNGKKSCVVPYEHPGNNLEASIQNKVSLYKVCYGHPPQLILLKNHGIICTGKTIDEVITSIEIAEKSAEIFCGILSMRCTPDWLEDKILEALVNDPAEKYRKSTQR